MIIVGAAFIVFWALMEAFALVVLKAAVITGAAFILLGLVLGERPWERK